MSYGGDAWDEAKTIMQTSSGKIYVAGNAKSSVDVMWLLRVSESGRKKWAQIYYSYPVISPNSIIETSDKSIVVAGYNAEHDSMPLNLWVMKLDSLGEMIWEKNYDGQGEAVANKIIQTKDNGFAIAGHTCINTDEPNDWWVLKLDSLGNFEWEDFPGGSSDDKALGITEMPDGSIVATGFKTTTNGSYRHIAISKYDKDGTYLTNKDYRVTDWDEPTSIITTSDNSLLVCGHSRYDPLIDFDAFIMKLSADGDSLWKSDFECEKWEYTANVIETYDNGFAIGGTSSTGYELENDYLLIKFDKNGKLIWTETFKRKSNDFVSEIIETKDKGILLAGSTSHFGNGLDYGLLKYQTLDRSKIIFLDLTDSVVSLNVDTITIRTCIQGFKKPKKVDVFINNKYITTISSFTESIDPEFDFLFNYDAKLENGINIINFKITDFSDEKFEAQKVIYYIPPPVKLW